MSAEKKWSDAHIRASAKWNAKAYDDIKFRVPKGQREQIKQIAEQNGYSLNGFITEAVMEKLDRMEKHISTEQQNGDE